MPDEVIVYSTPTCPHCTQVKNFLDANNIDYKEYNVAENTEKAQEMIQKTGQRGVPVTEVDGEIVVGSNTRKLKKLLDID